MHDVIITQVEQRYLKERCKIFLMSTITSNLNHSRYDKRLIVKLQKKRETQSETQTYSFLFQRICFLLLLRILT